MRMIINALFRQKCVVTSFSICVASGACEREAGRVVDVKTIKNGDIEIMVIRSTIKWYDEFVVKYWCRSSVTEVALRTERWDNLKHENMPDKDGDSSAVMAQT